VREEYLGGHGLSLLEVDREVVLVVLQDREALVLVTGFDLGRRRQVVVRFEGVAARPLADVDGDVVLAGTLEGVHPDVVGPVLLGDVPQLFGVSYRRRVGRRAAVRPDQHDVDVGVGVRERQVDRELLAGLEVDPVEVDVTAGQRQVRVRIAVADAGSRRKLVVGFQPVGLGTLTDVDRETVVGLPPAERVHPHVVRAGILGNVGDGFVVADRRRTRQDLAVRPLQFHVDVGVVVREGYLGGDLLALFEVDREVVLVVTLDREVVVGVTVRDFGRLFARVVWLQGVVCLRRAGFDCGGGRGGCHPCNYDHDQEYCSEELSKMGTVVRRARPASGGLVSARHVCVTSPGPLIKPPFGTVTV